MPDGYDTIIGSAGRELSGGERQRISIAPRAPDNTEHFALVDTQVDVL